MNSELPSKCKGCGQPLLLENLYVSDGCPCNSPRGINMRPRTCEICQNTICVKPGHHLSALFGHASVNSSVSAKNKAVE